MDGPTVDYVGSLGWPPSSHGETLASLLDYCSSAPASEFVGPNPRESWRPEFIIERHGMLRASLYAWLLEGRSWMEPSKSLSCSGFAVSSFKLQALLQILL
jgi:hypothetical protein